MNKQLTKLGNFVRPRRQARQMSLSAMAKLIGKSPAAISLYEVQDENFPVEWIGLVSEALGLTESEREALEAIHLQQKLERNDETEDPFLGRYLHLRNGMSKQDFADLSDVLLSIEKRISSKEQAYA
jgi:transcriptional regulator with XRE-family HTH domain